MLRRDADAFGYLLPDSISFHGTDPNPGDPLVISHWKKHNKDNRKSRLIQELNCRLLTSDSGEKKQSVHAPR
jgi:hypothetical protein